MKFKVKKRMLQVCACSTLIFWNFPDAIANDLNLEIVQQNKIQISGQVLDSSGMSVIGANVMVKGTNNGTITDLIGEFLLDAEPGDILVFSYIGMKSIEVKAENKSLNIILEENIDALDEVVVIGYGTVKKSNLSGAVSSVSGKDLQKMPSANLSQALQGNISGLYTLQSDRNPGAAVTMNIRGNNSFSGGSPLFIVDGFPIASNGGLGSLNPNDIESISVLKDASSTAIYGARAANGVVLITTKSGKIGKPVLEVSAYCGISYFNNPIRSAKFVFSVLISILFI